MKDEFLATVSHELRTPLNSILGWGQILNAGGLNEAEQKNALDAIFRNAKSQSQLIDDLLDTSRLISGNVHLDLSPTEIDRLHGPIGLDIGAKTPAEIAVAIVAEIVAVKNGVTLTQKKEGSSVPASRASLSR